MDTPMETRPDDGSFNQAVMDAISGLRTHMEEQSQRQQLENQALRAELYRVRAEGNGQPAAGHNPSTNNDTQLNASRPRPRYPDVTPYDGENPKEYRVFRVNLRTKFVADAAYFSDDEERILYAFGRLQGKASQRMLPWVVAKEDQLPTLDEFYKAMDQAFDDPEVQQKALVRVNTMKQGKRDLEDFLTEFQGTMIDAGGLLWSDAQKKALLDTAVNRQLLQGTIGTDQPESYEEYCKQLRRINHQQIRINRLGGQGSHSSIPPPRASKPQDPDSMDWEPTSAQVAALKTQVAALQQHLGMKEKGEGKARARWASESEMARRRREGSCLRCGSHEHRVRGCSLLPAQRPPTMAAAKASDHEREAAKSEEEEDREEESENV